MFSKTKRDKMNKIQKLWYNTIGKLANARIRFFIKLAGFCNIDMMKIVCTNKYDQITVTMDRDGSIHRVISMNVKIDIDKDLS